jgi:hypothetical protein
MAYTVLFDPGRRVLLVRFGAELTQAALSEMQAAVRRFAAAHGPCHGILDLGAVERADVSSEFLAGLAHQGAVLKGQKRILVAPRDEVFGLSRMFGLHQAATGDEPGVVRTLEQACALLGIDEPDWRPVEAG